jgi:hypothetical protein
MVMGGALGRAALPDSAQAVQLLIAAFFFFFITGPPA